MKITYPTPGEEYPLCRSQLSNGKHYQCSNGDVVVGVPYLNPFCITDGCHSRYSDLSRFKELPLGTEITFTVGE